MHNYGAGQSSSYRSMSREKPHVSQVSFEGILAWPQKSVGNVSVALVAEHLTCGCFS